LAKDRVAVLTRRAAARGLIDFGKARWYDPAWWRHCRGMFAEIEEQDALEVNKACLTFYSMVVARSGSEDVQNQLDKAGELVQQIQSLLWPWAATTKQEQQLQTVQEAQKFYTQLAGAAPGTATFDQLIAQHMKSVESVYKEAQVESDDARVIRKMRERYEAQRTRQGRR
jgi:hypothetical protein